MEEEAEVQEEAEVEVQAKMEEEVEVEAEDGGHVDAFENGDKDVDEIDHVASIIDSANAAYFVQPGYESGPDDEEITYARDKFQEVLGQISKEWAYSQVEKGDKDSEAWVRNMVNPDEYDGKYPRDVEDDEDAVGYENAGDTADGEFKTESEYDDLHNKATSKDAGIENKTAAQTFGHHKETSAEEDANRGYESDYTESDDNWEFVSDEDDVIDDATRRRSTCPIFNSDAKELYIELKMLFKDS